MLIGFSFLFLLLQLNFSFVLLTNCFSSQKELNENFCVTCGASFYYTGKDSPNNGDNFPSNLCAAKAQSQLNMKIIALGINSTISGCSDCVENQYVIMKTLSEALSYASQLCNKYSSCQIQFYLESSSHFIEDSLDGIDLFRRSNATLLFDVLPCGVISKNLKCGDVQAKLYLKTPAFKIYVSGFLQLRNMEISGIDMNVADKTLSCFKQFVCCNFYQAGVCDLPNFVSNKGKKSFGIINMELVADNPDYLKPKLEIVNCDFNNINAINKGIGFDSFLKSIGYSFFDVSVINTKFENVYFLSGVFSFTQDLENDQIYAGITRLELKTLVESNFGSLFCTLNFSNLKINHYNNKLVITPAAENPIGAIFSINLSVRFYFLLQTFLATNLTSSSTEGSFLWFFYSLEQVQNSSILITDAKIVALEYASILSISSIFNVQVWNLTISQVFLSGKFPLMSLNNLNNLSFQSLYAENISSERQAALAFIENCAFTSFDLLSLFRIFNLGFNFYNTSYLSMTSLNLNYLYFKGVLFSSDLCLIVIFKKMVMNQLTAAEPTNDLILLIVADVFNISDSSSSFISGKSFIELKNVKSASFIRILFLNLTQLLSIISGWSSFNDCIFIELSLKSSSLPAFAQFLTAMPSLVVKPSVLVVNSKFQNLILPSMLSQSFAGFRYIFVALVNTSFLRVHRVNHTTVPIGIIFISSTNLFSIENCSFISVGYSYNSPDFIQIIHFSLLDLIFINNYLIRATYFELDVNVSLNGGIIISGFIYNYLEIFNCCFIARSKRNGFIHNGLKLLHSPIVNISYNVFSNIGCSSHDMFDGKMRQGAIGLLGEDSRLFSQNKKKAFLVGNYFEKCACAQGGALFINNYHYTKLINSTFVQNNAEIGGSITLTSSTLTELTSTIIISSTADRGASILSVEIMDLAINRYVDLNAYGTSSGAWEISNSFIKCSEILTINSFTAKKGGFAILSNSNLFANKSVFINSSANGDGGGFFVFEGSRIQLIDFEVHNVSAVNGGFINCQEAKFISVHNGLINGSFAQFNGAAFFMDLVFQSLFENLSIFNAYANNMGLIYIKTADQDSFHKISQVILNESEALSGSCVFFQASCIIDIVNVKLFNCRGTAFFFYNNVRNMVRMKEIIGESMNSSCFIELRGLDAVIDYLIIKNSSFEKCVFHIKSSNLELFDFILKENCHSNTETLLGFDIEATNVSMTMLTFEGKLNSSSRLLVINNGKLMMRYCLVFSGNSSDGVIKLEKSNFSACFLEFRGNKFTCVFLINSNFEMNESKFFDNSATSFEQASDIFVSNKNLFSGFFRLVGLFSQLSHEGVGYILRNYKQVLIFNCSFSNFNTKSSEISTEAMHINNVNNVIMLNAVFSKFSTKISQGAALKVIVDLKFISNIQIIDTFFTDCLSNQGGGAFLFMNVDQVNFTGCEFDGNTAVREENQINKHSGIGGVGLVTCFEYKICEVFINNSTFSNNYAFYYGPLIISNVSITSSSLKFFNNSDWLQYTSSLSCFPLRIIMSLESSTLTNEEEAAKSFDLSKFNSKLEVVSGQEFKLAFEVQDFFGQKLNFDNKSSCALDTNSSGTKIFISNGNAWAINGTFTFNNLNIKSLPDSLSYLFVKFKIFKYTFLNQEPMDLAFKLDVFFLPCGVGEIILPDFSCYKCPPGSFSIIDPMKKFAQATGLNTENTQKCETCSPLAECPGGSLQFPKGHFWRSSPSSNIFQECFIPDACEGPSEFSISETSGRCRRGHFGNMCNDCLSDFGKLNSNSVCEECGLVKVNILIRLVFTVILLTIYTLATSYLYSINDGTKKKETLVSVFIKIGLNFAQTTMLISYIRFKWVLPSLRQAISSITSSISLTAEDVILNDCLVQNFVSDISELYLMKAIIVMLLPLIFSGVVAICWLLIYTFITIRKVCEKKQMDTSHTAQKKIIVIRLLATFIISVFLFHPLIVKTGFNVINCFQFDMENYNTDTYLLVSPSFRCWTSYHFRVLFIFVLPGILIWGIIFPVILIILLLKQRQIQYKGYQVKQYSNKVKPFRNGKNISVILNEIVIPENSNKKKSLGMTILKSNIFNFLFDGLLPQYSYWECLNFIKNFLISFFINANQFLGYNVMVLMVLLILFIALLIHITFQPYILYELNLLEFLNNFSVILIFIALIMLSTDLPEFSLYVLGVFISIVYLVFFSLNIILIVKIVKQKKLLNKIWTTFRSISPMRRSKMN